MSEAKNNIFSAEKVSFPKNAQTIIPVGEKKIQISLTQTQLRNSETKEPLPDLLELTLTLLEPKPNAIRANIRKAINPKTNLPYPQFKLSLFEWFNEPGDIVRKKLQESSVTGAYYEKIINSFDSRLFPSAINKGMITQKDLK